jgi:hypothetical protein
VSDENNDLPVEIAAILEKLPFLAYGTLLDKQYLGVIQNCDAKLISVYVLDMIPTTEMRELFLQFAHTWWWESNRRVPINMFIKDPRFRSFRVCLKHFSRKDFNHIAGPAVSLADSLNRRVRKRQVTLVRRIP